jgi:two-component system, OmpR family, heavy metal sensor histidine kinase CusS
MLTSARSLRWRLMIWNAGAVAATGLLILIAVRAGVRYTLLYDLDQVLREDLQEIKLHFTNNQRYDWDGIHEELNRKAEGHDFHRWFVQFYDESGQPTWSSINTPLLPPLTDKQKQAKAFSIADYRLSFSKFERKLTEGASVCVGCSQLYLSRDMQTIDRLVMSVGMVVLLVSPLVGHLLTDRAIRPLAQMIRTTARLHPGEFGERVPVRGTGDELDSLALTINDLLDRIASYLEQKHDFLANAAHDLRTPLAAIRSSVEVALSGHRSEDEYRELLGLVIEQCSALQTLVNQLLLLSETDADRLQSDAEPVPLELLVRRVVEMFEGVADEHRVELRIGELLPISVPGNRHHLRQVVSNLLDNAIKFTAAHQEVDSATNVGRSRKGCVTIDLDRDDAASQARLRVTDNGIGIDAAHLPHVFDRFYRADRSRGRDGIASGTGLGLSICKAIVDAHGGTIELSSQPGVGTSITILLPLVEPSSTSPSQDHPRFAGMSTEG